METLKKPAKHVTRVAVLDHAYTTVTREADPNDEWDRDSTDTSHHIYGIQKAQKYGDLECSFELLPNKTYYLLYYLYDTGDSFGSDTGNIEFVGLYQDKKLAEKSCDALNKFSRSKNNKITIWNDLGQQYVEHVHDDYFGGFTSAHVASVELK